MNFDKKWKDLNIGRCVLLFMNFRKEVKKMVTKRDVTDKILDTMHKILEIVKIEYINTSIAETINDLANAYTTLVCTQDD